MSATMRWTDDSGTRPLRHARVWLDPSMWNGALVGPVDPLHAEALAAWIAAGRAVVARRRDQQGDACCVAFALPLSSGRTRIGFAVEPSAIVRIAPPLALVDVVDAAPRAWRHALRDLHERGMRIGVGFRVYGSLAWQAISGEPCVTASSDVDLLWASDQVDRVLRLLSEWEADSGLRADGELILPHGDGVAWRELMRAPERVLVKHQDRVSLQRWPIDDVVMRVDIE